MKKLLMIFALIIGLVSCGSGENTANAKSPEKDRVEVIYFHGKQRCATCMAIEKNTREVINNLFANELKNGTVVFKIVDISTPEGEKIADKYEVTWSSLFVNKWKDSKETRSNLTEFAFGNARKNPDAFKKTLADKIRQSLK
jgi:hypothetical protein